MKPAILYLRALLIVLFTLGTSHLYASHIRAGDLTAVRIPGASLTYRFTVILYLDVDGVEAGVGQMEFGTGDDPISVNPEVLGQISAETTVVRYVAEYTFPSAGTYTVSYQEPNRNAGILNMSSSEQTIFYIASSFRINPILGLNSSPVFTIPPVDKANVGQRFIHNPGAYDPDGDSLAYRLAVPLRAAGTPVGDYTDPANSRFSNNQEDGSVPPIFEINPVTGDLIWNSPGRPGEYNIAFFVDEYRDGVLIGSVKRDMQIIVENSENQRPTVIVPRDTCIVAGAFLQDTIFATDPDMDRVLLEIAQDTSLIRGDSTLNILGSIYTLSPPRNPATFGLFTPTPPNGENSGLFRWQTTCLDVRDQPYEATFRAKDFPDPLLFQLADLQTWRITVVGPAPDTLFGEADVVNGTVDLEWLPYSCPNAALMQVYRRVGTFDFAPDACETGLPGYTGYQLIDEVPISTTNYFDDNNGDGLEPGRTYCYRLVAQFPQPQGGESLASMEFCVFIPQVTPYLTKVSVEETDRDNGTIQVEWTTPIDIDSTLFPRPYTYSLLRAQGLTGTTEETLLAENIAELDTTFTDTGLNTRNFPYNYRLVIYSQGVALDTSAAASSVRLQTQATATTSAQLSWQAVVPWNNTSSEYPFHYVYRKDPGQTDFVLIDSVANSVFAYTDNGTFGNEPLLAKEEYCYVVSTFGSYERVEIDDPLINFSQESCVRIADPDAPCAPAIDPTSLQLEQCAEVGAPACSEDCGAEADQNVLVWENVEADCDTEDIIEYNIYFSSTSDSTGFSLLATVADTTFTHSGLSSVAGCYYITAVDDSGNESEPSATVCNDTCPYYALPNVFTPNGASVGANDTFGPCSCYRSVENVDIQIYNRWGDLVYESSGPADFAWDGRNRQGNMVSPGVYFYNAEVRFFSLDPARRQQSIKGYVHVVY